ncbi:hypothetical protein O6H91_05G050200 [Diphasiastrum complanatum]|uniref:Uncharacterized protein n=1 Tax=Diphasiastrum complanatum TaxID=34168 RepID=A0ACC2DN54_DIPCM|nr:hypothetical protein O6H91_05G050200 [Diphasiastrum complanatum]
MSFLTRSPLRSQRLKDTVDDSSDKDLEAGEDEDSESDVFDISPKKPSIQSLKKWRQATLVLNASRRFRYTLDLKNREEDPRDVRVRRFRTSTHALRAIQRFKEAGARFKPDGPSPEGFELRPGQLALMIQEHRLDALTDLGGLEGLGKLLRTDLEKGIDDDPEELQRRKLAYGENTYPRKSPKNFLIFLWEACQDTTLIILMVCAALSLTLGMIVNGPTKGWYDGVSITFAVFLVIIVTACSDYKQSLQFRSLSEEKRNIQIQVARGGRRLKVSIYELVVGDVVPLQIGDQVPADGLLIVGYSLVIDESSMTGESELVHKDAKHPFLMAGCKVADGYGTMLITCVGTDTEWGQIMASISDDTGEETPLQVRLNGVATFIGQIGLTVAIIVFIMLFVR